MHEIQTDADIESTPERLSSIHTDFPVQSACNPFIRSIEGPVKKGRLDCGNSASGCKPDDISPPRWQYESLSCGGSGAFCSLASSMERTTSFEIAQSTSGRVRFSQGRQLSGRQTTLLRCR